jgi:hypothetical protein
MHNAAAESGPDLLLALGKNLRYRLRDLPRLCS